jgi:hypothetical protein
MIAAEPNDAFAKAAMARLIRAWPSRVEKFDWHET